MGTTAEAFARIRDAHSALRSVRLVEAEGSSPADRFDISLGEGDLMIVLIVGEEMKSFIDNP